MEQYFQFPGSKAAIKAYLDRYASLRVAQQKYAVACEDIAPEERDFFCSEFSFVEKCRKCRQDQESFISWLIAQVVTPELIAAASVQQFGEFLLQLGEFKEKAVRAEEWPAERRFRSVELAEQCADLSKQLLLGEVKSRVIDKLQEVLASLPTHKEGAALFLNWVQGRWFLECYSAWDELQREQEKLLSFARERYGAIKGASRGEKFPLGYVMPFPMLGYVLYEVDGEKHNLIVVCQDVAPAPYNLVPLMSWSEDLTEGQWQWMMEIVSGWSQSAGVKPHLYDEIQINEWMTDLSYIYQKEHIPFLCSKPLDASDRATSLHIQKVFDLVSVKLYKLVRDRAKGAACLYRQDIPRVNSPAKRQSQGVKIEEIAETDLSDGLSNYPDDGPFVGLDDSAFDVPWCKPQVDVESLFEMHELVERLDKKLEKLSEDRQRIASLKSEGWERKEIANKLNLSLCEVNTIVRQLQRLREEVVQEHAARSEPDHIPGPPSVSSKTSSKKT